MVAQKKTIFFYSTSDAYGEFSNFAAYPIRVKGRLWPTSEHYYQAQKFRLARDQKDILTAKTPHIAARRGRDRKRKLRRDWESIKESVMFTAVWSKFEQHPELRELLLSTEDAQLVEHTENDAYWGDGGDGKGKNRLGCILMQIRTRFQAQDDSK